MKLPFWLLLWHHGAGDKEWCAGIRQTQVQILTLSFMCCVRLGTSLILSEQIPLCVKHVFMELLLRSETVLGKGHRAVSGQGDMASALVWYVH